jgi:hypothetical protein
MKNRFWSTAQAVDSWAVWGIIGRLTCLAAAVLYWFGLIDSTPYSLVSGLFASSFSQFVEWFMGGACWLFVAVLWIEFVRYRVAVLEVGSNPDFR